MRDSLYFILYKHEVIRLIRSQRFRFAFPLLLLMFICASRLFVSDYTEHLLVYEQAREGQLRRDTVMSDNLTNFVNEQRLFRFSPRPDGFLFGCKENEMVNTFQYNVWLVNDFLIDQGLSNPFLEVRSLVDWTFIVTIFIGFIALLFSYDSVCGEKRDQVLAFLFSYPVSRKMYWVGKIASHVSVVMAMLLGGVVVGLLALGDMLGHIYSPLLVFEVFGFLVISFLFVTLFTCFGLFTSVLTRQSNVSLLLCVSFWLFSTVILPNSATFWGSTLYPVPLVQEMMQKLGAERERLAREAPPGSMAQEYNNPFYPYHERRAILFMKQKDASIRINKEYYRLLIRQFEGTRCLMLLSPSIQYERAMESLLGGGYLRFRQNWIGLERHREHFLCWFKEKDAQDPDSPHWYNPYEDTSTSKKPIRLEEVPTYQEQLVPIRERIPFVAYYFMITLGCIGLLVWGGSCLLGRYDVR